MRQIPANWTLSTVGEITLPVSTVEATDSDDREIRYIDIGSIDNQRNKIAEPKRLTLTLAPSRARQVVKSGDVLFATVRPYLRNIAQVPDSLDNEIASTGFAVLRAADGVEPGYLYYKAISQDFVSALTGKQYGVSYPAVKDDQVRAQPFELPPTEEQRRIVAKIEELFSELDKGVESLTTAREQLKAYRQSVLNRAVVGDLAGLRSFPGKPLSAIVEEIGQGWSPRCLNNPAADDKAWAVITTTAIQHGVFQEQENKQLPEELEPRPHLAIRAGDILITRAGPRKRVGVACLVRDCRPRLLLCDKAYRLRADTGQVLPEWLELVLNSPSTLQEIEKLKTGISDSGVNLTQNRFLELEVPVPTLAEQQAVLKVADSLTSQMTNLEAQIETSMQRAEALRQSILRRAFSGHLVAQDPSDESASVLLERIVARRENIGTTKRRNNKNGKKEAA